MKIPITGGTGFIGSSVAARYIAAGNNVEVVDNLSTGRTENLPLGFRLFEADITDYVSMERILKEEHRDSL